MVAASPARDVLVLDIGQLILNIAENLLFLAPLLENILFSGRTATEN